MISMTISDNYVYPSMEVSKIDNLAIKQEGIPGFVLMRRAADFSYKLAIECYPNTNSFIVFCVASNSVTLFSADTRNTFSFSNLFL